MLKVIYSCTQSKGVVIFAISAVIAGIHYPSDIIVGAILGMGIIYLYRRILPTKSLSLP